MIVLQLVLFCALFTLTVKLAVGNNALNALYFYPRPVQERVYQASGILLEPEVKMVGVDG